MDGFEDVGDFFASALAVEDDVIFKVRFGYLLSKLGLMWT